MTQWSGYLGLILQGALVTIELTLMGSVLALGLGARHSILKLCVILFAANSSGYFLGSALNDYIGGSSGMLSWGTVYGICLGAGLGAVLHYGQAGPRVIDHN